MPGIGCGDEFSGDETARSPKNFAKPLRFLDVFAWRSGQPV
jgi:hypothetical protein